MSSYFINNTSGTMELIVNPGELNGAGGKVHSTDLRLYGMGALKWGEGVDENFVRLLESFSCPQKELGDYGIDNKTDGVYDPTQYRTWPKGPKDREYYIVDPVNSNNPNILIFSPGPGAGITTPINGQVWFNTSANTFWIYHQYEANPDDGFGTWSEVSGGISIGPIPPTGTVMGDLWYDISGAVCINNQLMVYDPGHLDASAEGWVSVAGNYLKKCGDTMTGTINMDGNRIANVPNPVDGGDVISKQFADDVYVNTTGDTMTGALILNENSTTENDVTRVLNQGKSDERYVWRNKNNTSSNAMSGWLQLKNELPSLTDSNEEYYSVPVKLLKEQLGNIGGGSGGTGAFYYGHYWINASQSGGPIRLTFDFAQWKIDFAADYGNSDNFVVIAIPVFEQLLIPNTQTKYAKGEHGVSRYYVTDAPGQISAYGLVYYNARSGASGTNGNFYPDPADKTKLQVIVGPDTVEAKKKTSHKNYAVYGESTVRIHFFGGNINIKTSPVPSEQQDANGFDEIS